MREIQHEDPFINSFVLFFQAADAIMKYTDIRLYKHARISKVKYMVLQILEGHGGTAYPSEIARLSLREAHGITTLIRRLQREGLVVVKRSDKDRRFVAVTITDKGRALLETATPIIKQIIDLTMSSLGEEDVTHLGKLLAVMKENACTAIDGLSTRGAGQARLAPYDDATSP
jgi:DNA-binding MarR family transcriptional regulator